MTNTMKATIIKKRSLPKNLEATQQDIAMIFEELIGANRVDLLYAYPKFGDMVREVTKFAKLSTVMSEDYFLGDDEAYDDFVEFSIAMVNACTLYTKMPEGINMKTIISKEVPEDKILEFTKIYNKFRESTAVNGIILSASRLKSFENDIRARDPSFIYNSAGLHFKPFSFMPEFDIYHLRSLPRDSPKIKTWVSYMSNLFDLGNTLADKMQLPDINIDKFCNTVIQILTAAESGAGLNDCKEAFKTIRESMDLLKKEFPRYYKTFVNSDKNSSVIFFSFIKDVSEKNKDAKMKVSHQFVKILNYYLEQMNKNGQKVDPQISELIQKSKEMLLSASNE